MTWSNRLTLSRFCPGITGVVSQMGMELLSVCQVETRRVLWIVGMIFALVLVVQRLEHPYGNLLSSILSAAKVPLTSLSTSQMVGNVSLLNDLSFVEKKNTTDNAFLDSKTRNERDTTDEVVINSTAGFLTASPVSPMVNSPKVGAPTIVVDSNVTLVEKDGTASSKKTKNSEQLHNDLKQTQHNSSLIRDPEVNKEPEVPVLDVYSMSDMKNLLLQSRASDHSVVRLKVLVYVTWNVIKLLKCFNSSFLLFTSLLFGY